ncbi:lasso RiPP family leader peptide-containing protein [Streptomyces sp. NPDC002764]
MPQKQDVHEPPALTEIGDFAAVTQGAVLPGDDWFGWQSYPG